MKKTIANVLFLVICVAGIIFLLLPFLETTPPPTTELKSVQPQVSSSNPLAIIAKRLGSLFKKPSREKKAELLSAQGGYPYTPSEVTLSSPKEIPSTTIQQRNAAAAVSAELNVPAGQPVNVPPVESTEYGDASLLADNGEWVLIRQTAPQPGAPGMHEVNVHDNPYDQYVKQERARRFQPPARQADIPDSKWARLLRPVKQFFGLEESHPVENRPLAMYRDSGSARAGSGISSLSGKNPSQFSSGRSRLPWPDITPAQWARMTEEERERERERRGTAEFVELLSGTRAAEDAASIVAEAKYPDPKDEGKKEQYRQQLTEENKQAIKEGLLAAMQANAQGQETVDDLEHIMGSGCSNASLPKTFCAPGQKEEAGSLFASNEVTALQEQNRQTFLEMTKYNMPKDLPLLPVLGPTTPETIANMGGLDDVEKTAEIYRFLYEKNNCASQTCYWIPNSIQSNQQLADAFKLANTKLVTDPDNTYPSDEAAFERYKLEQAKKQQSSDGKETPLDEAKIREQAKKQFTENAANWITVTASQLNQIHQTRTVQAAQTANNPHTNSEMLVMYLANPIYSEQLYHDLGDSPLFGYALKPLNTVEPTNTTGMTPTEVDKQTAINMAQLVTQSLGSNVNIAFQIAGNVTKQAVSEGTSAGVHSSKQKGTDMAKAVQNRNTQGNSTKK